jgi:hypothetical protein
LDVHKGEDDVLPPIDHEKLEILFEAIRVYGVGCVDGGQDDIVEESLKSWDRGSSVGKKGSKSIRCCDAESQDLSIG